MIMKTRKFTRNIIKRILYKITIFISAYILLHYSIVYLY